MCAASAAMIATVAQGNSAGIISAKPKKHSGQVALRIKNVYHLGFVPTLFARNANNHLIPVARRNGVTRLEITFSVEREPMAKRVLRAPQPCVLLVTVGKLLSSVNDVPLLSDQFPADN